MARLGVDHMTLQWTKLADGSVEMYHVKYWRVLSDEGSRKDLNRTVMTSLVTVNELNVTGLIAGAAYCFTVSVILLN